MRYDRARALVEQLKLDVKDLLSQAERADGSEEADPQALPAEIARREALREKRQGKAKGKKPKPPDATPGDDEQSNLTDPDSRLMRKNKTSEYRQCYNAQAAVDAEGSMLILGTRITQCASDRNELVATIPGEVGSPDTVWADNGYACGEEVETLSERGIDALVATGAQGGQRQYDFRPPKDAICPRNPRQSDS